jgi:hypothetical protein
LPARTPDDLLHRAVDLCLAAESAAIGEAYPETK